MNVLLLTEEPADHQLFQESLVSLDSMARHRFTASGSIAEVWARLRAREIPLPSLIFVDFELSRTYDHELVQILKSNPDLEAAPVIVFADSAEQEQIVATYRSPVACFVVFPRDRELRRQKIHACLEFWSKYAELPELRRWWGDLV
jgi:CheY-like chemotaxis protein